MQLTLFLQLKLIHWTVKSVSLKKSQINPDLFILKTLVWSRVAASGGRGEVSLGFVGGT